VRRPSGAQLFSWQLFSWQLFSCAVIQLDEAHQWADIIVGDLAAPAGPFANSAAIVFGGAGVVAVEETAETIEVMDSRVAGEAASLDESSEEIVPELERTVFAKTVSESKSIRKAEFGRGRGVIHPSSSLEFFEHVNADVAWLDPRRASS